LTANKSPKHYPTLEQRIMDLRKASESKKKEEALAGKA
jgi:hypothetical protein